MVTVTGRVVLRNWRGSKGAAAGPATALSVGVGVGDGEDADGLAAAFGEVLETVGVRVEGAVRVADGAVGGSVCPVT
jgi:hypothetical protein